MWHTTFLILKFLPYSVIDKKKMNLNNLNKKCKVQIEAYTLIYAAQIQNLCRSSYGNYANSILQKQAFEMKTLFIFHGLVHSVQNSRGDATGYGDMMREMFSIKSFIQTIVLFIIFYYYSTRSHCARHSADSEQKDSILTNLIQTTQQPYYGNQRP